jgi:uncharacterized protein (TIGR02246 family)
MKDTSRHSQGAPEGWHSVTPRIVVARAQQLVEFVKHVFGATGDYQSDRPSVINIGDSVVMISDAGIRGPIPAFLYVYVDNTDEVYRRALQAGARGLEEPADMPYGDRRGMVEDEWGNTWQIATYPRGTALPNWGLQPRDHRNNSGPCAEEMMPADLPPGERAALEHIVSQLEAAWNAMDGSAFAAPFAGDADFVNIRGEHFRGRPAIAAGHVAIFRTIYAGSTVHLTVEGARLLRPEVALVRVHSLLDAPQGPLAGRHGARFSLVLAKGADRWEIAAFHNTLESAPASPRAAPQGF